VSTGRKGSEEFGVLPSRTGEGTGNGERHVYKGTSSEARAAIGGKVSEKRSVIENNNGGEKEITEHVTGKGPKGTRKYCHRKERQLQWRKFQTEKAGRVRDGNAERGKARRP